MVDSAEQRASGGGERIVGGGEHAAGGGVTTGSFAYRTASCNDIHIYNVAAFAARERVVSEHLLTGIYAL